MRLKKIWQVSATIYLTLYLIGVLLPRKLPNEQFTSSNYFLRIFHDLLYYSGNLEQVANFFLLMPVFAFLLAILGREKSILSLVICISLSATSETLQLLIPGRVSSLRDFLLNSTGALTIFLLSRAYSTRKHLS